MGHFVCLVPATQRGRSVLAQRYNLPQQTHKGEKEVSLHLYHLQKANAVASALLPSVFFFYRSTTSLCCTASALCCIPLRPSASAYLVVVLNGLGEGMVDHEPHVSLIDSCRLQAQAEAA